MKLTDFICEKCGECCRHLDKIPNVQGMHISGVCIHLNNNICSIYDNRPVECNRFKLYELVKDNISEEDFMNLSLHFCKEFKKMASGKN